MDIRSGCSCVWKIYNMYSQNLFVLDFARRFFVSCAQIFEAYAVRTLIKFGCDWRKIGRKGKCMKDSESTFLCSPGIFLCLILRKDSGSTFLRCCNMHDSGKTVFASLLSGILHIEIIVKSQMD